MTAHGASALIASAAGTRIALFTSEPFATAHTTGSSRSARTPDDLLRVQREVVAENARRLLRGDLGQDRDIVQDAGDVVDQREQARSGHRGTRPKVKPLLCGRRSFPKIGAQSHSIPGGTDRKQPTCVALAR